MQEMRFSTGDVCIVMIDRSQLETILNADDLDDELESTIRRAQLRECVTQRQKGRGFHKQSKSSLHAWKNLGRVVYEGILRIEEVGAFRQMLVNGLGPSKAYGCGLMTLARPRE